MTERTKGLVLHSMKYGETSLIVKVYTESNGLLSFILKGILKTKKKSLHPSYFQPLSLLQLNIALSQKSDLHQIREAQMLYVYETIHTDFKKQAVVFFISEMLSNIFEKDLKDKQLFEFLEKALLWFDVHAFLPYFHLFFLLKLTRFLGFYPNQGNEGLYFDLEKGTFTNHALHINCASERNSSALKALLGINFDSLKKIAISHEERQDLNELMLRYYSIHIPSFKNLKSLDVLKAMM